MIFWWGLGGNWLAQRPPGYHTIHFPRTDPREPSWGTISSTKPSFPGPHFWPQKVPGPAGTPIWNRGPKFGIPGSKNDPRGRKYQICAPNTMQNPVFRIPNGAICCKLWPKTILDGTWGSGQIPPHPFASRPRQNRGGRGNHLPGEILPDPRGILGL